VIWLHPYSYNIGYSRFDFLSNFVNLGFAVVAFDQIGFGVRNGQTLEFYHRYPKWSLLGKMVVDTRAAIDELLGLGYIDESRIYLCGWSLGAKIALYTGALDDRVAGVSAAGGFAPLRTLSAETGTEGLHHYSHIHGLIPRHGFFLGNESRLPVDYDEILACIAPRPLQVIAPTLDRYNRVEDVRQAVEAANRVYDMMGRSEGIVLETPLDFSRYWKAYPRQVDWLAQNAGLPSHETEKGQEVTEPSPDPEQ
jgi:pimeloyl-ACP methyl ester carboxylesterase